MTAPEPGVLATYDSRHEAEMALGILKDAGLAAAVRTDDAGSMKPELTWQGRVWLWVAGDEADEARALLSEAGLLHEVVAPTWAVRATGATGPSPARGAFVWRGRDRRRDDGAGSVSHRSRDRDIAGCRETNGLTIVRRGSVRRA